MNNIVIKPWGYEQTLSVGTDIKNIIVTKNLVIVSGSSISLQYHNLRTEMWVVKHGKGIITIEKEKFLALPNTQWLIPAKTIHRVEAIEDMVIWEHSNYYDPDDIVRLEDEYGRIK